MLLVHAVVVEAVALEHAGPEVLDQHVGALQQFLHHRLALGLGEVERHALLAPVEGHEEMAFAGAARARALARVVAAVGILDLDHLGAHVGQDLCAHGSRDHAGEIDDADSAERRTTRCCHGCRVGLQAARCPRTAFPRNRPASLHFAYRCLTALQRPVYNRRMGSAEGSVAGEQAEARLVVMLVYPGVVAMDVFGPLEAFASANAVAGRPLYRLAIAAMSLAPVETSIGIQIAPTMAVADIKEPIDTLLVSGGYGQAEASVDADL